MHSRLCIHLLLNLELYLKVQYDINLLTMYVSMYVISKYGNFYGKKLTYVDFMQWAGKIIYRKDFSPYVNIQLIT